VSNKGGWGAVRGLGLQEEKGMENKKKGKGAREER